MRNPNHPIPVRQADIDAWFADGPSDDKDMRVIDVIFLVHECRACADCGWQRVRSEFEVWETVFDPETLADGSGTDAPYTSVSLLCRDCTARRRARHAAHPDPLIYPACIRTKTRLADPITDVDP